MDTRIFEEKPVMGILRGITVDMIEPLAQTIASAGLSAVEIAMNTQDAGRLIRLLRGALPESVFVGAGTVLSMDLLVQALDAGASFIVMPVLVKEVVSYCVKHTIPVFPGALTPGEVYDASFAGATMVKIFPARCFGPAYFKELRGPLEKIKLLACGGVDADNVGDFFRNGASAVAFGSSIFKKKWLTGGEYGKISTAIQQFLSAVPLIKATG